MKRVRPVFAAALLLISLPLFSQDREAIDLYRQGQSALRRQDYYGAIDSLQEALRLNPAYLDVILALADAYFRIEEYEEAYNYIEKAALYGENDISLINMKARILVGREDLTQAEELFRSVLTKEPNNLEANLGLAEIALLRGDDRQGEDQYRKSLILAPESRRALLSLALLYDREGNGEEAEKYLNLALTYHSRDPEVHIALAEHYLRTGDVERASYFAQNGARIAPDRSSPFRLLGQAFMEEEKWSQAVDPLINALSKNPRDITLLYMLSQCYIEMNMDQAALKLLDKALKLDPENEIVRITMEQFLINNPTTSADQRNELSAYHRTRGQDFESSLYYGKAYGEYRRSRWIDPYDWEGWQSYGRILKLLGYPGKYLNTLQAMKASGYDDASFQERLTLLEHRKEKDLGDQWGVDQYNLEGFPYTLALYTRYSDRLVHTGSEQVLSDYLKFMMLRYSSLDPSLRTRIRTFSQAFSDARSQGSDYFVILDYSETERTFLCLAELYLTTTGAKVGEYRVMRTGKNRIAQTMEKMAGDLESSFIPRAKVISLEGNRLILGLGRFQSAAVDSKALLFKKGTVDLISGGDGIDYLKDDLLGEVTIIQVDEEISLGEINRYSLFDLISTGDELYFLPPKEGDGTGNAAAAGTDQAAPANRVDEELKSQLLRLN